MKRRAITAAGRRGERRLRRRSALWGAALVLAAPLFASIAFSFATTDTVAATPVVPLASTLEVAHDGEATADLVLATYDVCLADCGGYVGSDMATCALNCVGSTIAALDDELEVAPTCVRKPLLALASCETRCTSDHGRETDDHTCSLQCHNAAHARIQMCATED